MSAAAVPVERLAGVGPARAALLHARGIRTVLDLLLLVPTAYGALPPLAAPDGSGPGTRISIAGRVTARKRGRFRGRRGGWLDLAVVPGSEGAETPPVRCRLFNQPWLFERFAPGTRVLASGILDRGGARDLIVEHHRVLAPEEPVEAHLAAILPRHPRIEGIAPGILRRLLDAALAGIDGIPDPLDADLRDGLDLPPLAEALRAVHRPGSAEAVRRGRSRLLFDRFVALFLPLASRPSPATDAVPVPCPPRIRSRIRARFPFPFTPGQEEALEEILGDLARPAPMRRLLQGDVGSGKTAVALSAALAVVAAGGQVLFLAPTEPLAHQHHAVIGSMLAGSRVATGLLTAEVPPAARRELLRALPGGRPDLLVATHAALAEDVVFEDLRLVVIDEQQRFGVRQRLAARAKGPGPHLLSLSATPIPRTLRLALLGDLDHTLIRGRPPGRRPVATAVATLAQAMAAVREAAAAGGRAFVVFPAIASEGLPALEREGAALRGARGPLAAIRCAVLHGRQPLDEREAALRDFREGTAPVLLATAVVEVGIDVPQATVMAVVGAERFGLANLHQLRGRVGRGERPGRCLLVPSPRAGPASRARLAILERETDGFRIAEEDLRLRGPGELAGFRQAGTSAAWEPDAAADQALFDAAFGAARELASRGGCRSGDGGWYDLLAPTSDLIIRSQARD